MYQRIKGQPTIYQIYSQKLIEKGVITQEYLDNLKKEFTQKLDEDYKKVIADQCDAPTQSYVPEESRIRPPTLWGSTTGVPKDVLT